jgi:hypothetical protein
MSPRHSYAVSWSHDGGPQYVGKLELRARLLRLEGRGPGTLEVGRSAPYGAIVDVTSVRTNGHRSAVVELRDGTRIVVTSLDGPGALTEIESEIRARSEKPHS